MLTSHDLAFATREESAILPSEMARLTVSQRLAGKLKHWLPHGESAALVKFSHDRPNGSKISTQNLSYFLHGKRVNPIGLDDLDDIADYLNLSIGQLFDLKGSDLAGDEQRLVWAFRVLPQLTREHFLALLEAASVTTQFVRFRERKDLPITDVLENTTATPGRIDAWGAVTVPVASQVAQLAAKLDELSREIATIETNAADRRPTTDTGSEPPTRR